jgi:hypothetical protein
MIMDLYPDQFSENKTKKPQKNKKKKIKAIKINDDFFEIGLQKGFIEKNEDGSYVFISDYVELLAFKNNSSSKSFEWLD